MKNCRNCKHAKWYRTASGRRNFGHVAQCLVTIDKNLIPLSMRHIQNDMTKHRYVAQHENVEMDCQTWQALDK